MHRPRKESISLSSDLIYKTGIFQETMALDRFLLILRFLHFASTDNIDLTDPNCDRLGKIRPIINLICERCTAVFSHPRDVCIDESLVLFKGRLAFKQFIHTKRARFGIKIYQLCTTSSILLDFLVYLGKMSDELLAFPDQQFTSSELISLTLMRDLLNKGHRLFVDNFYTGPAMAAFLMEKDTRLFGTVRFNRKNWL